MIINDKQKKLLTKLLIDMRENQYYGKSLNKCTEKDISSNVLDVYNRLKPVTKKELLDNLEKVLSQEVVNDIAVSEILNVDQLSENHDRILETGEHRWYLEMTSGTSGFPFPIIKSAFVRYTEGAYILKCRKRIFNNASFANSFMLIHPIDERIRSISHRGYKSESFEKLLSYMEKKKPKWIFTGVNLLSFLSEYIIATNQVLRIQNIGIKFIEVTSQSMDISDKQKYESLFRARIINNYGCREVWNIAYECCCGKMHINTDYLLIDVVNLEGESLIDTDEAGEVIITSLCNKDMPLIKYVIGDKAKIYSSDCKCGCKDPVILLEQTREAEMIQGTNKNGIATFRKILRRLYFHDEIRDIIAIKIVQDDMWHFTVFVKKKEIDDNSEFERLFLLQAKKNIENIERYKVDFIYDYPFDENNYMESEKIFRNSISNIRE